MKKILNILFIFFVLITLSSCIESETTHKHHAPLWSYDKINHYYVCVECNNIYNKANHEFDNGKILEEATLDNDGLILYTCNICGYQKKETIKYEGHIHTFEDKYSYDANYHWKNTTCGHNEAVTKEEHKFSSWNIIKEATENEDGQKEKHCTICGYQIIEKINKSTHEHSAKNYSYDEEKHYHKCSTCNEIYDEELHQFSSWNIILEPTETLEGLKERTCIICNYKQQEVIPRTVHNHTSSEVYNYDANYHYYICDSCGETYNKEAHTMSAWVILTKATEENQGIKQRKCNYCDYEETKYIPVLEHTHKSNNTYYYNDNYHYYICSGCGEAYNKEEHDLTNWTTTITPTATYNGAKERHCNICNYSETGVIPAITIPDNINYNYSYNYNYIKNYYSGSLYSTGNFQHIGDLEFYRFNYNRSNPTSLATLTGLNNLENNNIEDLNSAIYNTEIFGAINYIYITYKSYSNSNLYYSNGRNYENVYVLESSYSYTTVELSLNQANYFKLAAGNYDLDVYELKLAVSSQVNADNTNTNYEGYRINYSSNISNLVSGVTKGKMPIEVTYKNGKYTVIKEKEYTYYDRSEVFDYITTNNSLGPYQDSILTDPVDICNYYLLFNEFPVNYLSKSDASYYYRNYSIISDDIRCVSEYSRTDGYVTSVPYNRYNLIYYELDIKLDSSYTPNNRGVGRLVIFANGFNDDNYNNGAVIVYTDDHYATFAEYNNLGSFLPRFDAELNYTGKEWTSVLLAN